MFDLLLRLRQAVNHPYLVIFSATALNGGQGATAALPSPNKPSGSSSSPSASRTSVCALCHDPAEDPVHSTCKHSFCRVCIADFLEAAPATGATCPACTAPLTVNLHQALPDEKDDKISITTTNQSPVVMKSRGGRSGGPASNSILSRIDLRNFQSSTKIEALREEIHRMLAADPSAKAIVFSQFTNMLDIVHFRLEQCGIKCVRLQGSMSMAARDRAIETFTADPEIRIFLMSLKAGGVALNLTAASHAFLLDSWWNPGKKYTLFCLFFSLFYIQGCAHLESCLYFKMTPLTCAPFHLLLFLYLLLPI